MEVWKRRKIFEAEHVESMALLKEICEFYSGFDASFLWSTDCSWELPFPTRYGFESGSLSYAYVGRRKAEDLYGKVVGMNPGGRMQILGAKGTGKSTAVCSMAGFLQGSGKKRVVYLVAHRFLVEPHIVLLEALLMSCRTDEQRVDLISADDVKDLIMWCKLQPRGSLLFIVDDWDRFEIAGNQELENDILAACSKHMLIQLSSVNRRTREIWSTSDKRDLMQLTVFFDGPFSAEELQTWIGQSKLRNADLKHLDRLTGGMPRLLRFYEKVNGDETKFMKESDMYSDILHDFVLDLKSVRELRAAVELVTKGKRSRVLKDKKMTCFYQDEEMDRYRVLSPHLRSLAERYLMEQNACLLAELVLVDMQTWIAAVRIDLHALRNDNPARVGWIIEGVIIAMIRFKQRLFEFEFKHCVPYDRGNELVTLQEAPHQHLEEGILFVPAALNEKAVDIVYARLVDNELVIKGVQITIAQWKAKAKKDSHQVWQTQVLPKWCVSNVKVSQSFYYVMPEGVKLADINDATKIRSFKTIDPSLAEFDEYLLKEEPKDVVKVGLKTCSGTKRDGSPCQNKSSVQGDYKCVHHRDK